MVLSPIHHHMENVVPMNIEPPSESFEIPNIVIPQRNVISERNNTKSFTTLSKLVVI